MSEGGNFHIVLQSKSNLVLYSGDLLNNTVVENFASKLVGKCTLGKGEEIGTGVTICSMSL